MALLDQIDIKILQALQNNAKVNMKELSAELNISKTPVYERVKRLFLRYAAPHLQSDHRGASRLRRSVRRFLYGCSHIQNTACRSLFV